MKTSLFLVAALSSMLAAASPTATVKSATYSGDVLNVTYELSGGPAVITFDIQTNVTGDVWASIGGAAVESGVLHGSEVWMKVTGDGDHSIRWSANAWLGNRDDIRAVVVAWPLDNPPNYMVADISTKAQPGTQRYYPEADFVPGGVLGDTRYRKTALLMRKVMAKGIKWTMGTSSSTRYVTLTNNYYIGVFEVTKAQWAQVKNDNYRSRSSSHTSYYAFTNRVYREMRPLEIVAYNEIRTSGSYNTYNAANDFPNPPHGSSFLGVVRARTGLDFDLPGEAQWEFAARAGHGANYWGDGASSSEANLKERGRYTGNGGSTSGLNYNCETNRGTATCGSYKSNSWGLYDVHGNVFELCLDWYVEYASTNKTEFDKLDYRVNIDPSNPSKMLFPASVTGGSKVKKGGGWYQNASACLPSNRAGEAARTQWYNNGFRVICPVEVP